MRKFNCLTACQFAAYLDSHSSNITLFVVLCFFLRLPSPDTIAMDADRAPWLRSKTLTLTGVRPEDGRAY
jgi:hypothetical protein